MRRMARAFVAGQSADEMDELLEELERAVGEYQSFMGVDHAGR